MRRFIIAVGLSAVLLTLTPPLSTAQSVEEVDCSTVVPTTTTVPDPTPTTVPPIPCDPTVSAPESPTLEPAVPIATVPQPTVPQPTAPDPWPTTIPPADRTTLPTTAATAPETTVTESITVPEVTTDVATRPSSVELTPFPVTTSSVPTPDARSAAANLLNIEVPSAMTGPKTITPGSTWIGTMSMSVLGVGVGGWKSEVSLSNIRGATTGQVLTPTSATYSAPESQCTAGLTGKSAAATVTLSGVAKLGKHGGSLCLTGWTATVSIGIPTENVLADTYTATLTHSIY